MMRWCRVDSLGSDGKRYRPSSGDPPRMARLKFGAILSIGPAQQMRPDRKISKAAEHCDPDAVESPRSFLGRKANPGNPTLMIGSLSKEDGKTAIARNQGIGRSQSAQGE
jgi:hypothetical protein